MPELETEQLEPVKSKLPPLKVASPDPEKIGFGSSFSYSTDNGTTYTAVARIMSFTTAKPTVARVPLEAFDNATFNSLPVEDSMPGWVSPGTYQIKAYYGKTKFGVLRGLLGVTAKFKIIKSDGSGYTFSGYLSDIGDEIALKEAMTCEFTVQIAGGSIATFASTQA